MENHVKIMYGTCTFFMAFLAVRVDKTYSEMIR